MTREQIHKDFDRLTNDLEKLFSQIEDQPNTFRECQKIGHILEQLYYYDHEIDH